MVSENAEGKNNRYLVPFLVLLAAYCVWILTLPLFPSLDGSLHLYYASVMGSLLSGSKAYSSYYFIRHILPPYALHYYFLIAVAHFFGYVMADKLLVCLIFVTTAFGFRYLARFLGPSGDLMSLFIIPLLLNWPLGMGFYNYCLAIGMALWALGFWYRAVERRSQRLWLAFLGVVILMVLTHPVPLILIYVLVGVDVGWRFWQDFRRRGAEASRFKTSLRYFRADLVYMLLSWATIGYVFLFVDKHKVVANVLEKYDRKAELIKLLKLSTVAMFSGSSTVVVAYRLSLYAILLLALVSSLCEREEAMGVSNLFAGGSLSCLQFNSGGCHPNSSASDQWGALFFSAPGCIRMDRRARRSQWVSRLQSIESNNSGCQRRLLFGGSSCVGKLHDSAGGGKNFRNRNCTDSQHWTYRTYFEFTGRPCYDEPRLYPVLLGWSEIFSTESFDPFQRRMAGRARFFRSAQDCISWTSAIESQAYRTLQAMHINFCCVPQTRVKRYFLMPIY